MIRPFEGAEPAAVFHYFQAISAIPRGSGNREGISNYVAGECRKLGASVVQDKEWNVIAVKAATPGRENDPAVMLQGHMDLVAEKTADSTHDFEKDGLTLLTDGEYLFADRTTLGADDGIAVAYMLALLADEELSHPRLECVFTTDEETGMFGANGIDLGSMESNILLNLDNEDEGTFIASCAGGARFEGRLPLKREEKEGIETRIVLTTEKGGHSGVEIHHDRPNANVVLGNFLYELTKDRPDVSVISFDGGKMDNAITTRSEAVVLSDSPVDALPYAEVYHKEFASTDDNVHLVTKGVDERVKRAVWTKESAEKILSLLYAMPNGVIAYHHKIKGLVDTSLNRGILRTEEDQFILRASVRSSVESRKKRLLEALSVLVRAFGGEAEVTGDYPGWPFAPESKLREFGSELWNEMYPGCPAKVEAIHAGLECGILLQKKPDLDILSFGPNAQFIHTPQERLNIASAGRVYAFLQAFLREIGRR